LRGLGRTAVYSLYQLPQAVNANYQGQYIGVVSCPVLRDLAVLGRCAPGVRAVQADDSMFEDDYGHHRGGMIHALDDVLRTTTMRHRRGQDHHDVTSSWL
jgi:hypothetical protein